MSWSGPRGGSRKDAAGAQEEGGSTEGQCGAESTEGACLGNAVRMWRQRMQQASPLPVSLLTLYGAERAVLSLSKNLS